MIDSGFDPAVIPIITRVAELAGIKDSTLVVSQDGQTVTVREKFERDMIDVIKTAHWRADDDPSRLKSAKKTRKLAGQLEETLHQDGLFRYLPFSDVRAVSNLVSALDKLERYKKRGRPKKWTTIIRKRFVNGLFDAVRDAGGKLGLNRRNGRGSLVDAIDELQPYLPSLFEHGLSVATLRQIKTAWLKNQKNNSKKRSF